MNRENLRSVVSVFAMVAVVLFTRASFADHYRVPSGSMSPTVHVGDHIVVSKLAYGLRLPLTSTYIAHFGLPARGDVVVIAPPKDSASEADVLLKRIAAVAGDEVEVRDGRVRVNDGVFEERWLSLVEGGGPDFGPARVPEGKLLVLGDNRGNSRDGRTFGWIDRDRVIGRAVAVLARDGELTYVPLGQ